VRGVGKFELWRLRMIKLDRLNGFLFEFVNADIEIE